MVTAADPNVVAFTFRDGAIGCTGCEDVWAMRTTRARQRAPEQLLNASISNDGDRIVFATERQASYSGQQVTIEVAAAVYDRSVGTTTILSRLDAANDSLSYYSNIALSGNGKRVAFTTQAAGVPHYIVADIIGG